MKRFSEQFKKQSESIRMRASERDALRERVLSYMEYHPLHKQAEAPKARPVAGIVSEPFVALKMNSLYFRSFAGVFAVFLIIGVPFIAEHSVPGDMLYPVKIQFNEEVRSGLSLSPYAKVAWETERLERRISEARLLASEGKLTEETEMEVAAAVKTHTDAAQRGIAQLRENDSDEAAIAEITFASALAVQTEVLESHIEKNDTTNSEGGSSVLALAQVVNEARTTAEATQFDVRPSYDRLLGSVEAESTNVYELFASVKDDASNAEMANVERRLADIERKVAKATALKSAPADNEAPAVMMTMKVDSEATTTGEDIQVLVADQEAAEDVDAEAEAIKILSSALTDIQKLITYMTDIDVRRSVTVEELVPLTLTPEEQSAQATELLGVVMALQSGVSSREVSEKLVEKVAFGQQELEIKIAAAVELMGEGNYEAAIAILEEAHVLASDLDAMTEDEPLKTAPVLEDLASTTVEEDAAQQ